MCAVQSMAEAVDPLLRCFDDAFTLMIRRTARSGAPLLLCGETGSGKTVVARAIHRLSARAAKPFIRVDCGAIPEPLFEREMFGHNRGSFTDAKESQAGLFEAADGGTLFLDEVGELPLSIQPKLLSVLDDGCVRRLGTTNTIKVNVRIIAATNRDLAAMVGSHLFRADLFYRIGYLKLSVPPLRQRRQWITRIAAGILQRLLAEGIIERSSLPDLHPRTQAILRSYSWPGNVRELEQVLAFATTFFESSVILPEHLPPEIAMETHSSSYESPNLCGRRRYVAPDDPDKERVAIIKALELCSGNRTRAAKHLGMSRATLWIKLRQFGL